MYRVEADGLTQVFDSGNDFEAKTAAYIPAFFNCSNDDNAFDSRSAKKGPEPESVTVGIVEGRTYAFVALERIGGIMVYDITDPDAVTYSNYINTRDFAEDPDKANPEKNPGFSLTGDFAPEGLYFIGADQSPSSTPILLAAFEVSARSRRTPSVKARLPTTWIMCRPRSLPRRKPATGNTGSAGPATGFLPMRRVLWRPPWPRLLSTS